VGLNGSYGRKRNDGPERHPAVLDACPLVSLVLETPLLCPAWLLNAE
jgi:hypothetical protein